MAIDLVPVAQRNGVFAALNTARAVRRFRPDPVEPELLESLIWAATRAPSPENDQLWEFVVVADQAQRRAIGELVARAADAHAASLPPTDDPAVIRTQEASKALVRSFGDTPAIIFVCHHRPPYPEAYLASGVGYSAVFMAAANILVAARSLGLGAAFTFIHMLAGPDLSKVLRLPSDVEVAVTIPVGWPAGPVGPVARRDVRSVLHWDGYQPL